MESVIVAIALPLPMRTQRAATSVATRRGDHTTAAAVASEVPVLVKAFFLDERLDQSHLINPRETDCTIRDRPNLPCYQNRRTSIRIKDGFSGHNCLGQNFARAT